MPKTLADILNEVFPRDNPCVAEDPRCVPDNATWSERIMADILHTYKAKDSAKGIGCSIKDIDNQTFLIRDAMAAKSLLADEGRMHAQNQSHNFMVIAYSYLIAYVRICETNDLELDEATIERFKNTIATINETNAQKDKVSQLFHELADSLAKKLGCSEEQAATRLNTLKSWISLQCPTMTIATRITIHDEDFVLVEIPLAGLTVDLQAEFSQCMKADEEPVWFRALTPDEQALLKQHIASDKIDTSIFPGQLRDKIPGLKNAWRHELYHRSRAGKYILASHYNHCGTVAFLNSSVDNDERQRLTKMTLQQLHTNIHPKQAVNDDDDGGEYTCASETSTAGPSAPVVFIPRTLMITLNSPLTDKFLGAANRVKRFFDAAAPEYRGLDTEINELTATATNSIEDVCYANVCANAARRAEHNDYSGMIEIRKWSINVLRAIYGKKTSNFGRDGKGDTVNKEVSELAARISWLIDEFKNISRLHHLFRTFDGSNRGLKLINAINEICMATHDLIVHCHQKYFKDKPELLIDYIVCFGCASGDNRTGVAEFHLNYRQIARRIHQHEENSRASFSSIFRRDPAKQKDIAIQERLVASYAIQLTKGLMGGDPGTDSLRSQSKGALSKDYHSVTQLLFSECSDVKSLSYQPSRDSALPLRSQSMVTLPASTLETPVHQTAPPNPTRSVSGSPPRSPRGRG